MQRIIFFKSRKLFLVENILFYTMVYVNSKYHPEGAQENPDLVWEIDFTPPFQRFSMIRDLERECGAKLPSPLTYHTEESRKFFDDLCVKFGADCSPPRTTTRLLDKVRMYSLIEI